jgi:hypothetical protein
MGWIRQRSVRGCNAANVLRDVAPGCSVLQQQCPTMQRAVGSSNVVYSLQRAERLLQGPVLRRNVLHGVTTSCPVATSCAILQHACAFDGRFARIARPLLMTTALSSAADGRNCGEECFAPSGYLRWLSWWCSPQEHRAAQRTMLHSTTCCNPARRVASRHDMLQPSACCNTAATVATQRGQPHGAH